MPNPNLFKRTGSQDFSKFLKVMISGPPKSGKTTLLGTVPGILVLDTEPHANNLESIAHLDVPYATITSSQDLKDVLLVLGNESLRKQLAASYGMPDIGAVAIDTLDTLQKILKAERLQEMRQSQFLRDDWGWLKTEMEKIVESFTALPMHVFFVVHTKTQEIGKGDDAYTVVLPGLEGAIAQSIAGMVGYSLLAFRKEEIAPDGTVYTKYWLRTEGDRTHDFLGTRTAGRLPTIIEPNMATIYSTVMANRPKTQPSQQPATQAAPSEPEQAPEAPAEAAPQEAPQPEEAAQNVGQSEQVQTPVETETSAPEAPVAAQQEQAPQPSPQPSQADKPGDDEPVSPAALGHVKRVYDAIQAPMPQDKIKTMGEARTIVKYWKAVVEDHRADPDQSGAQAEMREILQSHGWMLDPSEQAPEPAKTVTPKVDGTIEEVLAYIRQDGDGVDLDRVQEAYELELAKGDDARKGLIQKLEGFGAKPQQETTEQVQTGGETAQSAVTSAPAPTDVPPTEEEAVKAVEEGLDATLVAVKDGIPEGAPCDVCGEPIDDHDLAELGYKRFDKVLCVKDYLAQQRNN